MWFFKSKEDKKAKQEALIREGEIKQRRLSEEITKTQIKIGTFEQGMDRKLKTAVNKALYAKSTGDTAALKNAYIDIKMAMKFKALAGGMNSAMTRLASNMDFAKVAKEMAGTLETAGELTKNNPNIDIGNLDSLYNKAMAPLENIVSQIENFNQFNIADPNDSLMISDDEVERVIQQVAKGMTVAPPVYAPAPEVVQPTAQAAPQAAPAQQPTSDVDKMISELAELAKSLS